MAGPDDPSDASLTSVILTAGNATRMGDMAPDGCKALVEFRGRPIIEWQIEQLGESIIVCQTRHAPVLEQYGYIVTDDSLEGPAHALQRGLHMVDGPVVVAYSDTFWEEDLPEGEAWCGVAQLSPAAPSRVWDVVRSEWVYPMEVFKGVGAHVCVGLYRFEDAHELRKQLVHHGHDGAGLAYAVNALQTPFVEVKTWRDIGTREALDAAEAA